MEFQGIPKNFNKFQWIFSRMSRNLIEFHCVWCISTEILRNSIEFHELPWIYTWFHENAMDFLEIQFNLCSFMEPMESTGVSGNVEFILHKLPEFVWNSLGLCGIRGNLKEISPITSKFAVIRKLIPNLLWSTWKSMEFTWEF